MPTVEKTISTERIYEGKILNLRKDTVEIKDGKLASREIIEHNGAVAILAVTDDNRIVMVSQYRKACEKELLEIPAGKLEKGEDPKDAALRELKEETGYVPGTVEYMTRFYNAAGYSSEMITLYMCRDLIKGEASPDEDEDIELSEIDIDTLYDMCLKGEIEDSKTIIGVLMAKEKM